MGGAIDRRNHGMTGQTIAASLMLRRSIGGFRRGILTRKNLSQIFAPAVFSPISMLRQGQIGYGPCDSLNAP
jgi:hypothetical protein